VRQAWADIPLFAGVALLLACALGVLVMRTPYDRLHYASAAGWGAGLVAVAIVARESFSLIGDKALATAAALVLCGPVLAHVTARAGRVREHGAWNEPRGVEAPPRESPASSGARSRSAKGAP
jgi:multisubunit Na+/H+ antiporter MnhG subunit